MKKKTNVELENELKIVKNQKNQLEEKSIRLENSVMQLSKEISKKDLIENDYIEAFMHSREMEKIRLEIKKSKLKKEEIALNALGQFLPPIIELIINEIGVKQTQNNK